MSNTKISIAQQVKKEVVIYKSRSKNGMITITYANRLGNNAVSTEKTQTFRNNKGAIKTLALYLGLDVECFY